MGWLNINGNWIGRHSGQKSWSTYWKAHLFGEDDLLTRLDTLKGLTLTDSVGNNDSEILPAVVRSSYDSNGPYFDTGIIAKANTIWVVKGAFYANKSSRYMGNKSLGGQLDFGLIQDTNWYFWWRWGNQDRYSQASLLADNEYHVFIMYNKKFWICDPDTPLTDESILNVINTVTPNDVRTTATFTQDTTTIFYGDRAAGDGAGPKFDFVTGFLGEITDNVITWNRKHIFNNASYAYDIINEANNKAWVAGTTGYLPSLVYSIEGSDYCIRNGYSRFVKEGAIDIHVPYLLSGLPQTSPLVPSPYVWIYDVPSVTGKYNLADALIQFTSVNWDRGDTNIWSDLAREASFYDDTSEATRKRWHISELNNLRIKNWANDNYKGLVFVKMLPNSVDVEARISLVEIFEYNESQADDDINKIHNFCGDYDILQTPYLLDPYNDVLKVTALSDSVFRLNVNDSIVYTKADLWAKIDAVPKLNAEEDDLSRIFRWMRSLFTSGGSVFFPLSQDNIFFYINSHGSELCSDIAITAHQVLEHYYPGESYVIVGESHTNNQQENSELEMYFAFAIYKDRFSHANMTEITADEKLFTEPLRITTARGIAAYTQANIDYLQDMTRYPASETITAVDNLVMQLPKDASFVFPIKGTTPTKGTLNEYILGNSLCAFPAGVTGIVKMPFGLMKVTGTGTVKYAGVEYNLPADEAALYTVLQNNPPTADDYGTFEIVTNTGDIAAEYLVNNHTVKLFHNNTIEKGIISGDIKIEAIPTTSPIWTTVLSVDNGDADSWTLDFNRWFTANKSIKTPSVGDTIIWKWVTFNKSGGLVPLPEFLQILQSNNTTWNKKITAGTSVIDQCWAAKLMPRNDSFTTSLELSFTAVDDSDTYYTLDGSTPDATKTKYTAPFTISATTTVKWINIKEDYADSHVNTRVITKS